MTLGLLAVLYGFTASFVAHEYGHVLAARMLGWRYLGWYVKFPWAAGVKIAPTDRARGFRLVAAGGVAANVVLAMLGYLIGDTPLGMSLLVWNLIMILFQLIPVKGTDGYSIVRGWRAA